jgi:hypothetical protein
VGEPADHEQGVALRVEVEHALRDVVGLVVVLAAGDGEQCVAAAGDHLAHLVGAALQDLTERMPLQAPAGCQQHSGGAVAEHDAPILIGEQDGGRRALEHGVQHHLLLQKILTLRPEDIAHLVEQTGQFAQLIAAAVHQPHGEVAIAGALHAVLERLQEAHPRPQEPAGQPDAEGQHHRSGEHEDLPRIGTQGRAAGGNSGGQQQHGQEKQRHLAGQAESGMSGWQRDYSLVGRRSRTMPSFSILRYRACLLMPSSLAARDTTTAVRMTNQVRRESPRGLSTVRSMADVSWIMMAPRLLHTASATPTGRRFLNCLE